MERAVIADTASQCANANTGPLHADFFLALPALYRSWAIPFSAMPVMPLGLIGAIAAVMISSNLSGDFARRLADD